MKISEIKTLDNVSAIYCFRNTINNKCYVGQAEQLRKRLLHHINNFNNCRYDAPLYRAMTKYGLDVFEVEILEIIDGLSDRMEIKKKLDEFEIHYIEHLNSYAPNGYNQTRGGDAGVTGYKFTEEQKCRLSENTKRMVADGRYTIYCYDIINNQYITEVNTPALAKHLNINIDNADIRRMLCKKQYILARSKEKLEEKIKFYKENLNSKSQRKVKLKSQKKLNSNHKENLNSNLSDGKFKKDPRADEIIKDIKGGMTCAVFMCKYNMCKKSYYNYKNEIFKK